MKRLAITWVFLGLLLASHSYAQSGAVIPQSGAGHASKASCVILKRMGPADEVTSHLYSFGFRGKQFQYIEGKLPEGFPFHGRMTDHDVRNLQARGSEVIVLESHYTSEDLKQARKDCQGETGKTPNQADGTPSQADAKALPAQAATVTANPLAPEPKADAALVDFSSSSTGADIEVDGSFVGSTPSSVSLSPGDHEVTIKKNGFTTWQRKIKVSTGHININAELAPIAK